MSQEDELNNKYRKAANIIIKAGILPFPVTDTVVEILKFYLDEDDLDFIQNFKIKSSLSLDQLVKKSKLPEKIVIEKANKLAKKRFIFNQPSSSGIMVYRLLPLVVIGTFEYTFMSNIPEDRDSEKYKKLAQLYEKIMDELKDKIQGSYDNLLPIFKNQPPVDRTIPVYENIGGNTIDILIDKEIEAEERVLPAQHVEDIINKFDDIAVGNCFCRHYHQLLGDECKIHAPLETCFTFGKSARHVVQQGFARKITKEEAIKILRETEEVGLIHKAFHNGSDINREENSICNCCKDCCDTFNLWRMGATPMVNSTNYLSIIDQDLCSGCGTCVDRCPVDAIILNDDNKAERNADYCIGCGICAHFCPESAISLQEGMRTVYVPPPKLR